MIEFVGGGAGGVILLISDKTDLQSKPIQGSKFNFILFATQFNPHSYVLQGIKWKRHDFLPKQSMF